jgi:hypothetical protein
MPNEELNMVRWLSRHFVRLGCQDRTPGQRDHLNNGAGYPGSFSGFVASVRGEWFMITAGHVIEEIEKAMQRGQKLEDWHLDDTTAWGAADRNGLPFDLTGARKFRKYSEKSGLDWGFIHIHGVYRPALERNGIVPLDEAAWQVPTLRGYDEYWLLGVPEEKVGVSPCGRRVEREVVLIVLELIEKSAAPPCLVKNVPRLYAKLPDAAHQHLNSIVGMSGGPLFGAKTLDGQVHYWVIGLQSEWDPGQRVIAACPTEPLLEIIDAALAAPGSILALH